MFTWEPPRQTADWSNAMARNFRRPPVEPIEEVALSRRYDFDLFKRPLRTEMRSDPLTALLSAFRTLARRGVGPNAFGASFADSPLTFLLDTMQDAVLVRRGDGTVVYKNRAAEDLTPIAGQQTYAEFSHDGSTYERRCMRYLDGDKQVVVEVITRRR
jgi:PAS domain-containing protein